MDDKKQENPRLERAQVKYQRIEVEQEQEQTSRNIASRKGNVYETAFKWSIDSARST